MACCAARETRRPMGMPGWWAQRRFGLRVDANLATVPAWAPIGEYADWYWSHLGDELPDVAPHPHPLVEVLAHHRDRWGHIERYDDFLPLLTFDRFDPDEWAQLAVDAGCGYSVFVTKHHDGWCWWDAPNTGRTMLAGGPRRNVLAEYAQACRRHGVVLGTYYSLLDWGDPRYPDEAYVDEVLHPHVLDLVERYGSAILWGDGHWAHDRTQWRTGELLERVRRAAPEMVVNDRWGTVPGSSADAAAVVRTYEYDPPDDIVEGPWELCRGVAHSLGHNRAERAEHHLDGIGIVALLTEVVAKGGHLLLDVGPAADGTVSDLQRAPLREAGNWVRRFDELLVASTPWLTWGDEHVRYLDVGGVLHVVDVGGRGHFGAVESSDLLIGAVTELGVEGGHRSVEFHQDDDGLHVLTAPAVSRPLRRPGGALDVRVYRVEGEPVAAPIELFAPTPRSRIPLAPLLDDTRPGDIVQLGDGVYVGPVTVPRGVIVRGLGGGRTVIDGDGEAAIRLHRNARVEHLRVTGAGSRQGRLVLPVVEVVEPFATVLGCDVDGHILISADDATVRATTASGIVTDGADRTTVSRCELAGNHWDVGIELRGGNGHEIDSCQLAGHLCAVRASDTTGVVVRGNDIVARWWGVHLQRSEGAHLHGNRTRNTMRAVDVDGGAQALIDGNAVFDGDSGCVLENGASGCQVSGNHWERCRIGLLAWDVTGLHHQDNHTFDLHEPEHAVVTGP